MKARTYWYNESSITLSQQGIPIEKNISPIAEIQSSNEYHNQFRCGRCNRLLFRYNSFERLNKNIQIKCDRCKAINGF